MRKLSLGRSLGVFTLLLFNCEPEFLINNSACLGSASISNVLALFQTAAQSTDAHDSEVVLHMSRVVVVFLEFSNLSPCCKCRKILAVSEYTDVFDMKFVQTRVEHSNVAIQFLHRPFTVQIKALCRVLRSVHCAVEQRTS